MSEENKAPEVEEIDVEHPDEPELKPDVVMDPEDTHVEGVDKEDETDARATGEQPPLDSEGPEPGMPAQSKEEVSGDGNSQAAEAE